MQLVLCITKCNNDKIRQLSESSDTFGFTYDLDLSPGCKQEPEVFQQAGLGSFNRITTGLILSF